MEQWDGVEEMSVTWPWVGCVSHPGYPVVGARRLLPIFYGAHEAGSSVSRVLWARHILIYL